MRASWLDGIASWRSSLFWWQHLYLCYWEGFHGGYISVFRKSKQRKIPLGPPFFKGRSVASGSLSGFMESCLFRSTLRTDLEPSLLKAK